MKVFIFLLVSLFISSSAMAGTIKFKNSAVELATDALDGSISVKDVAKVGVTYVVAEGAIPTAVAGASALGVTASTGTAISTLSGAAAVSATSAAVGAPVAGALSVAGIVVAPAVVGGVIITTAAVAVAWGFNEVFLSDDED